MKISLIRLSCKQSTGAARRNQIPQTELAQVRVQTDVGRTIRALAAASQMNLQTLPHVMVEIAVSSTRIAKAEVSGPAFEISIQILN